MCNVRVIKVHDNPKGPYVVISFVSRTGVPRYERTPSSVYTVYSFIYRVVATIHSLFLLTTPPNPDGPPALPPPSVSRRKSSHGRPKKVFLCKHGSGFPFPPSFPTPQTPFSGGLLFLGLYPRMTTPDVPVVGPVPLVTLPLTWSDTSRLIPQNIR